MIKLRYAASKWQSISRQEYFPLPENKMCMHLGVGSTLSKCLYFGGWTKEKCDLLSARQLQKKSLSHSWIKFETPQCKQLSMSAAAGLLTLAAACTSKTSALNFIALFPDGVAVLCILWQHFVRLVIIWFRGNITDLSKSPSVSNIHTHWESM